MYLKITQTLYQHCMMYIIIWLLSCASSHESGDSYRYIMHHTLCRSHRLHVYTYTKDIEYGKQLAIFVIVYCTIVQSLLTSSSIIFLAVGISLPQVCDSFAMIIHHKYDVIPVVRVSGHF